MAISLKIIGNYVVLFIILIVLGILYKRFEDKRIKEEGIYEHDVIRKYLLNNDSDLENSKKPILWIHVPYEYNSRNWLSFGSRSSYDLNQPYLYLCVKTIIDRCDDSFTICIIDDNSFEKLLPNWSIKMNIISTPVLEKVRALGLMKLLHTYGGMLCPISFLCMKDLIGLYEQGTTQGSGFFACETNNHNVSNQYSLFYPNIMFSGATKENEVVEEYIHFIQHLISSDYTADSVFSGDMNTWLQQNKNVKKINGMEIGIKTRDNIPILIEDLMSQKQINLYPGTYGILIPSREIINRRKYEWFARLSHKQVLESDTIIGNYFVLANASGPTPKRIIKESMNSPNWISFWKVPSDAPLWGIKPNFLGDNLIQLEYPVN